MRFVDRIVENRTLSRWATLLPRPAGQRGGVHESDAELLPLGDGRLLALTIDAVIEEVRVGLYETPFTTGWTATVSSLSDLAAVAADPLGLLISVTLPTRGSVAVQTELAGGIRDACAEAGVHVLGGDTNEGPDLAVTVAAAGVVPADRVLTRIGARAGDLVFGSGPFGLGAALAVAKLRSLPEAWFREAEYRPAVRLRQGRALRGVASACMDTSDGLVAALDQLTRVNDVRIRVIRSPVELLHPRARDLARRAGLPPFPFLAGHHGEFELVFAVPPDRMDRLYAAASEVGWDPLPIGRVEPGSGLVFGDQVVDGVRIRNLLTEVGGDLRAYTDALLAMPPIG